jgi:hypothetical protein
MKKEISQYNPSLNKDNIIRIDNGEDLELGSYWTCIEEDGGESVTTAYLNEVLILAAAPVVDGFVHHVVLLTPPNRWSKHSNKEITFKMANFYRCFKFCPNGKELRKAEMDELQGKMKLLQDEVVDVTTNPARIMSYIETSEDEGLKGFKSQLQFRTGLPSPDSAIDNIQQTSLLVIQLNNQKVVAQATHAVITNITKSITNNIQMVGNYHREIAEAAILKVSGAIELAKEITKRLATLDVYLGTNVELIEVKRGKGAKKTDKVAVYQELIYMDEECLINAGYGGADYNDIDKFFKALKADDNLVNRVLPFERQLVVIRPRREKKAYSENSILDGLMNKPNFECFVLIRNGENIHAVFSEMTTMPRLFPSTSEMDAPFNGRDGRNITKEDIEYVSSRNKMDQVIAHYKRVLLLIQGVYERDIEGDVFGILPIEQDGQKAQLLDPAAQIACFNFISEESKIGDGKQDYDKWINGLNSKIVVGSRIMVCSSIINEENCSGLFTNTIHYDTRQAMTPADDQFKTSFTVLNNGGRRMIKIEASSDSYESSNIPRNYWLDLEGGSGEITACGLHDIICLDNITLEDIDYYLNSRQNRKYYKNYINLMFRVRRLVIEDEKRNDPFFQVIKSTLTEAGVVNSDKGSDKNIRLAMALQRTKLKGDDLLIDSIKVKKNIEEVVNIFWQQNTDLTSLIESVQGFDFGEKRELIAIMVDAKNNYSAICSCSDEVLDGVETMGFPWFAELEVGVIKGKFKVDDKPKKYFRATDINVNSTVVWGEDRVSEFKKIQAKMHKLTFRRYKNALEKINTLREDSSRMTSDALATPTKELGNLIKGWESARRKIKTANNTIDVPVINVPLGLMVTKDNEILFLSVKFEYADFLYNIIDKLENGSEKDAYFRDAYDTIRSTTNEHYPSQFRTREGAPEFGRLVLHTLGEIPDNITNRYKENIFSYVVVKSSNSWSSQKEWDKDTMISKDVLKFPSEFERIALGVKFGGKTLGDYINEVK